MSEQPKDLKPRTKAFARRLIRMILSELDRCAFTDSRLRETIWLIVDHPVEVTKAETRWLDGLYFDQPEEWDDPYRFFRW